MPKVSVIIPSYNHEKFIPETIKSILDQTYQNFEVIIVDDGSKDETVSEIEKFKDIRIKLICNAENQGAAAAMNICIEEAKGKYVAVLNSDDVFMTNKLENQLRFLEEHPEISAVFSFAQIIDEEGNEFTGENHFYHHLFEQHNRTRYEWLNYFFFNGNCLCHPSVLIRKECYNNIGYYDRRLAQLPDYDFWIRLCMKYEIYIIPEKLIKFRLLKGEQNASGKRPEAMHRYQWELTQVLKNFLSINNINDFRKVFPEVKGELSDNLIPFYIATQALKKDIPAYKIFALDALYSLMENGEAVEELSSRHNFSFADFIKITGKYDLFNLYSGWISTLYIDTGNDFNQRESISQILGTESGSFGLTFNVSGYSNIRALRWDPIENMLCKVKISSVSFTDKFGGEHCLDISKIAANAIIFDEGVFIFEFLDPMIFLPVEGDVTSLTLLGNIELLNIEEVLEEKNRLLQEKDRQLHEVINSWRGRALIRKVVKLFKRP